jgi:hypothetical protein
MGYSDSSLVSIFGESGKRKRSIEEKGTSYFSSTFYDIKGAKWDAGVAPGML